MNFIAAIDSDSANDIAFLAAMVNRSRPVESVNGQLRGGAISIGNFDGVHRGHAALLARLRQMADRLNGPAVAVTFDPSPASILRPEYAPTPLTTLRRRAELIKSCGIDDLVVCHTDAELLGQSPDRFFKQLVVNQLAATGMVEGPNFYFGKQRAGNIGLLKEMCIGHRIELEILDPETDEGNVISSTRVRELIGTGNIQEANGLLTEPYRIEGTVVEGAARGRKIGFPHGESI